ncbi:MAG: MetQ/NlpA family lipoprotein [Bacteroidota bacterium]|jgi:D-methionine transport system substrate-binding protein
MKKIARITLQYFLILLIFACTNTKKHDPNTIRVGIAAGPERQLAEAAVKEAKEKYNLDVELFTFNDYVIPNEALNNGDIDVNVFQHEPYLNEQQKQRGYQLAIVGKTFIYPLAAYSKKINTIDQLQEGSVVAIPNDASNGGRALLLLEKQGLIKLKNNVGLLPKTIHIVDNPKQLTILEIEAPQLPIVLNDKEVSLAIINNNFAAQAGLNINQSALFKEDKHSPYVNLIVARTNNQFDEKIKKFVKSYQSEAVEKVAQQVFKGAAVKGW